MSRVRGRVGTVLVAAVLGVVTMIVVQRLFLVLPLVSALPAGLVGGALAAWSRPEDELPERLVTATGAAVATVVAVGLWMVESVPSGYLLRIVLGWVVVAVVLAAVHAAVTSLAPFVRGRTRRDPVARLR